MDFERDMLALLPDLRAFARVLVRRHADADDLVQDAVLRMWQAQHRFEPGTNLRAWAFTILRNRFYNAFLSKHAHDNVDDVAQHLVATPALQERLAEGRDIRRALHRLEPKLREVLALTVASGLSHDDAARVMGCPVGTVKSRAFRARRELRRLLDEGAQPLTAEEQRPTRREMSDEDERLAQALE
ncbi:sigma-70 family RNA polymerase sigma factor [Roseomonas sp. JC162]|uniref:Sigma-70 family RNA polymerase sigma factor n=1 Tax=Neoroseomonas marina TaxID=1232220 RepID=A0A848EHP9_9PROT|nr:sigma-70 family RNA polymerase sigma factor [Neoroseomonas marina]NMJ42955.1 sigma-70 family RNA polymerase sigma factor [Neoroseomonas marina]